MTARKLKPNERLFGCHVSAAGGLVNALKNAQALEINSIQIHASPPQQWNTKPFAPGIEEEYLKLLPETGVKRVFFHGIYLINLATADAGRLGLAQKSLQNALDLLSRIGAEGVIFHLGSMKDQADESLGLTQVAEQINRVLDKAAAGKLILEVAAGGGQIIGDKIEELAEVYEQIEDKSRVGFALDSQHLWASGYDLQNELEEFIDACEKVLTLKKIWAIHLNDSKTELGSRKDRHENIGEGLIGQKALKNFFLHPRLAHIPFILETPAMKTLETAALEVTKLRRMLS